MRYINLLFAYLLTYSRQVIAAKPHTDITLNQW